MESPAPLSCRSAPKQTRDSERREAPSALGSPGSAARRNKLMLDCYTTDGQMRFQFDKWGDIAEDVAKELDCDDTAFGEDEVVLVVLRPSGRGSWVYASIVYGDLLRDALASATLISNSPPSRPRSDRE